MSFDSFRGFAGRGAGGGPKPSRFTAPSSSSSYSNSSGANKKQQPEKDYFEDDDDEPISKAFAYTNNANISAQDDDYDPLDDFM
jgi:hypothetical protein